MKGLIAFILSFAMTSASFAESAHLNESLQTLQYDLTVEWDQQDQKFYTEKVNAFAQEVAQASPEELKSLISNLSQNQEVNQKISQMIQEQQFSLDELVQYALVEMNASSQQGASWNGTGKIIAGVAVVALVVLTYYYIAASRIKY